MNFASVRADASRWGWRRSIFRRISKYAASHLGIHIYYVRTCALLTDPQFPETLPGIVYRSIDLDELLEISVDPELDMKSEFIEAATACGDIAFGAFDGTVLACYTWRALSSARHTDEMSVRVNRPYSYSYKTFTRPAYRGKRFMPAILLFSDKEMLKHEYTHRAGFVAVYNLSSLAAGDKSGSRIVGYAGYLELFGRRFPFRTQAAKNIGFEFFEPGRT